MNTKEKQFAILLKEKNKHYIYQPYSSIFGEFGYMPDFYVIGEGFYEVVGSRQAFSQNRRKIFKTKSEKDSSLEPAAWHKTNFKSE